MKDQLDEYVKKHGIMAAGTVLLETDEYRVVLEIKGKPFVEPEPGTFEFELHRTIRNYNGNLTKFSF